MNTTQKVRCDYLLLTALDDEARALESALTAIKTEGPTRVRVKGAPTMQQWVISHQLGNLTVLTSSLLAMGHDSAREWTRLLLEGTHPKYVGFVGIAGAATEDAKFGQVLIAERIWYYEPAKVTDNAEQFRGAVHLSGRLCLDRLKTVDIAALAALFPQSSPWQPPLVGTIASGEKVIASASRRDEIRSAGRDVVGFEMEGHSFADEAEKLLGRERWFMVRGIQDKASATKSDEHRVLAANRAAQFTIGFIVDSDLCIPTESAERAAPLSRPPEVTTASVSTNDEVFFRIARKLSEKDPAAFLEIASSESSAGNTARWSLLEAEANWRLGDVDNTLRAAQRTLELNDTQSLSGSFRSAAKRLAAWSIWRQGNGPRAIDMLKEDLHEISDQAERGRWTDLLATVTRFTDGDANNFDLAVGWYQQAFSLKEAAKDFLGCAIALKQIAFTYVENLDFDGASRYFRRLLLHSEQSSYIGNDVSLCYGTLGLAWMELLQGTNPQISLARQRLKTVAVTFATHPILPNYTELRLVALALRLFKDSRSGYSRRVPERLKNNHWASLIGAQICILQGKSETEALSFLAGCTDKPSFVSRSIHPILMACKRTTPEPHREVAPIAQPKYKTFWPLSLWLNMPRRSGWDAAQLLEGLGNIYLTITSNISEGKPDSPRLSLGAMGAFLQDWAVKNKAHVLSGEVLALSALIGNAAPARNQIAHSTPGQSLEDAEVLLIESAERACGEIGHLLSAHWVEQSEPTLEICGLHVSVAPLITRESRSGKLMLNIAGGRMVQE